MEKFLSTIEAESCNVDLLDKAMRKKARALKRRKASILARKRLVSMAESKVGFPYYFKTTEKVHEKVVVQTEEYLEEKKYLYREKKPLYVDKTGKVHYYDCSRWEKSGEVVFHPAKTKTVRRVCGYRALPRPRLVRQDRSKRIGEFKKQSASLERRLFKREIAKAGYEDLPDGVSMKRSSHKKRYPI